MIKEQRIIDLILTDEAVMEIDDAIYYAEENNTIVTFGSELFQFIDITTDKRYHSKINVWDLAIDITVEDLENHLADLLDGEEIIDLELTVLI